MKQIFPITEKNQDITVNSIILDLEKMKLDRIINIQYEYDVIQRQNIEYVETINSSPYCLLKPQFVKVSILILDDRLINLN